MKRKFTKWANVRDGKRICKWYSSIVLFILLDSWMVDSREVKDRMLTRQMNIRDDGKRFLNF